MSKNLKQELNVMLEPPVSLQEVNRLLELGKLLASVLSPEEIDELHKLQLSESLVMKPLLFEKIGNTGVS